MGTLILEIPYGGLGDHLFYSHIPRLAKDSGRYAKVYISNRSEYRHPDYRSYIWERNPYVDGFVDEAGDISPAEPGDHDRENILDAIMLSLGIDDGRRFHEPEIYFVPKVNPEWSDLRVYDPNFVTDVGDFSRWDLQYYLLKRRVRFDVQLQPASRHKRILGARQTYRTASFEDFCSVIVSCRALYCLTSGTATLAAALGRSATAFWGPGQQRRFHHSRLHSYERIDRHPPARVWRRLRRLA